LDLLLRLKPGFPHLLSIKLLYLDSLSCFGICFSAIAALVVFGRASAPGLTTDRIAACTAISPARNKICTWIAKTAPCFAPSGWCLDAAMNEILIQPSVTQQRLLTLTAGPLAHITNSFSDIYILRAAIIKIALKIKFQILTWIGLSLR
jgi:hypothetical protein